MGRATSPPRPPRPLTVHLDVLGDPGAAVNASKDEASCRPGSVMAGAVCGRSGGERRGGGQHQQKAPLGFADGATDRDGALAALEEAVVQHRRSEMPFELARTLLVKGRVHRRRKEKRLALEALQEALRIFEHVGAPLWTAKVSAEVARLGRRTTTADELTETERRVAELAAAGLANSEIAERAFLGTKAVEANLTRVYRKLGIHSRGGLARALQAVNETDRA